jgi:undecaprenyl-phosphate 4-deoxy-4-formamido-L-arabinose transferase
MPTSDTTLSRRISVVTPVYNSEGTLAALVGRLEAVLKPITTNFEIILVNDGSRDKSWQVIGELSKSHASVVGIDLMRNYGQHNALLCGILAAKYEILITIDDDLQNPPEEIGVMLGELDKGVDVVYGYPEKQQHGLLRALASEITKIVLQNAMGAQTARRISAFRVFRTNLRGAFTHYRGPFVSIDVLLTWGTSKFAAVQVKHDSRSVGASNYTVTKLITHAMNMLTGFTTFPLQMASLGGFALTFVGIVLLLFVVGRYILYGTTVQGFTFLASAISMFSGAQLFALGIIGEYLARLHMRSMERPAFAVRQSTSAAELSGTPKANP